MCDLLVGLSKNERPILNHHTKAHNLKSGGFHVKSAGFQSKDPLARNCNPMLLLFLFSDVANKDAYYLNSQYHAATVERFHNIIRANIQVLGQVHYMIHYL